MAKNKSIVHSPKRPPRNIDVLHSNENNGTCNMESGDTNQLKLESQQYNGDINVDKDYYELKKLRLEARMNMNDNNTCQDNFETLFSSDYLDSIKINVILGQTRVNELFKNVTLLELIKFDVKEVVNKRLEECYRFRYENVEEDNNLLAKVVTVLIKY